MTNKLSATVLSSYQARIHTALLTLMPAIDVQPARLHQAMHYAVFNGGKRLRPLFTYVTGSMLKAHVRATNPLENNPGTSKTMGIDVLACAVELIHAYSLIHDDLPAMDDDDWRRGKPACHKAFDEATAILAGDALQTLAFSALVSAPKALLSDTQRLRAIDVLATASGSLGMAGGQMLDLMPKDSLPTLEALETLYRMKTGALINASIMMGLIAANIGQQSTLAISLQRYADCVSLAFQIQDDILDVEGDINTLGKIPGGDDRHAKPTYVAVAGLETAKEKVATLKQTALEVLDELSIATDDLREMTEFVLK